MWKNMSTKRMGFVVLGIGLATLNSFGTMYANDMDYVLGDAKQAIIQNKITTEAKADNLLAGFKKMGVNGIRVPIFATGLDPNKPMFDYFYEQAVAQGFLIFANPAQGAGGHRIACGVLGGDKYPVKDDPVATQRLIDTVQAFSVEYPCKWINAFNEDAKSGGIWSVAQMNTIYSTLHNNLNGAEQVGPCVWGIPASIQVFNTTDVRDYITVATTHNLGFNHGSWPNFIALADAYDLPVWDSECTHSDKYGTGTRLESALANNVDGIVLYNSWSGVNLSSGELSGMKGQMALYLNGGIPQSLPYAEGFEDGIGDWQQSNADDFNWSIGSGYTDSNTTGPSEASEGLQYLFAEGNNGGQYGTTSLACAFDLSTVARTKLSFDYHMTGGAIGTLAVDVFDGTAWTSDVWSRTGEQQSEEEDLWLQAKVDLTAFVGNPHVSIRFRYNKAQWALGDPAIDNVRVEQVPESLPYSEGFESGLGAWTQASDDDFDWSIGSGYTESNTTGPSEASEGTQYLFAEGHDGGQYALTAVECSFDLSTLTSVGMTFDYHMCGNNIDYVALDVFDGSTWTFNVWKRTGPQQADELDPWLQAEVDLSAFAGNPEVKLRFNYQKAQWAYGDPAIDNIQIMSTDPVAPVADSASFILGENRTVSMTLTGSDANGDSLTYEVADPAHGDLSGTAPDLIYTADAGFNGLDHFTFTVSDGLLESAVATVSILDVDMLQIISPAGSGSGYDVGSTEAAAFRSSGTAKTFDTDGDDVYGTAGTFFYGNGVDNTSNSAGTPSWVTAVGSAGVTLATYADYTDFDNPTLTIADAVANWTTTTIGLVNPAGTTGGLWSELMTFTVDATAPRNFRLGVMAGNENTSDGRWDPAGLRVSFAGGTAVEVGSLGATTLGMVFFDVTLPDNVSGTFSVEGQNRSLGSLTRGPSIAGITFDIGTDPYAQWATTAFTGAPGGTDQTASGNPDGDRFNNAEEWALVTDPLQADKPTLEPGVSNANFVATYYRRDPAVTGIDVYASWATSLLAETWKVDGMTESSMGWSNEVETVSVLLPLENTNAFIRIQADQQ